MKKPLVVRRVAGSSMWPGFRAGDIVVAFTLPIRMGDVVIAHQAGREVLKRVATIKAQAYYLQGDNVRHSTDSRTHGPILAQHIIGRVVARLPAPTPPPTVRRRWARHLGYLLAVVMVAMVLVHLYRIDTFIPVLDAALPGALDGAMFMAVLIVSLELAALPFLMSMRLSPLAHMLSGGFVIMPPLYWTLVTIWAFGDGITSTGQLGGFLALPASIGLLLVNVSWLAVSFYFLNIKDYSQTVVRLRKRA